MMKYCKCCAYAILTLLLEFKIYTKLTKIIITALKIICEN